MTAVIALLSLIVGLGLGFYAREVRNYLSRIYAAVLALKSRQDSQDQAAEKPKVMTYAEPLDLNAMTDEERIAFLNR